MLAEKGLPDYVRKDLFESISRSVKILTMCDNQKEMAEKLFGQNVLGAVPQTELSKIMSAFEKIVQSI